MSAPIAFVDCETTGLDPDQHQIWEVALITPDAREHVWQFPVDEMTADPFALNIGRYWDRCWPAGIREVSDLDAIYEAHSEKSRRKNFPSQGRAIKPDADWCRHFRDLTAGLHLAGAVVSFDEERLRRLLHRNGVLHRWHYHLQDFETLIAGYLRGRGEQLPPLPWKSDELSRLIGVEPPSGGERHTALGDARWAKRCWDAVMGQ